MWDERARVHDAGMTTPKNRKSLRPAGGCRTPIRWQPSRRVARPAASWSRLV
jgi:hypothetical protein